MAEFSGGVVGSTSVGEVRQGGGPRPLGGGSDAMLREWVLAVSGRWHGELQGFEPRWHLALCRSQIMYYNYTCVHKLVILENYPCTYILLINYRLYLCLHIPIMPIFPYYLYTTVIPVFIC